MQKHQGKASCSLDAAFTVVLTCRGMHASGLWAVALFNAQHDP